MTRAVALLLLLIATPANATISGALGHEPAREAPVFFLRTGERLALVWKEKGHAKAIAWHRIEPELRAYDNHPGAPGPLASIRYRRRALHAAPRASLELTFATPGTRYYGVGAAVPERFSDSEPLHRQHPGRVVQVVVRAGDDPEDFLGELLGTPFIMGPAVAPSGWHQTDQRVGSDCAAFATYGQRRMGRAVPYAGPVGIVRWLRPLARDPMIASRNGTYRDTRGRTQHIGKRGVQRGDIVHFGPQVSIFHADRGRIGVLDADDLLLQSWRTTPHVTTLRDSGFFRFPIRVYRWR